MAVRTAARSIALLLVALLASCGEPSTSAPAETKPTLAWQAQCLKDMATNIDSEITSLEAGLPVEDVEWEVSAELGDGAAIVKIIPRRIPSIRGGGGEYRFSCQDKTFELVQSYR